jgi:hypothetical protein
LAAKGSLGGAVSLEIPFPRNSAQSSTSDPFPDFAFEGVFGAGAAALWIAIRLAARRFAGWL